MDLNSIRDLLFIGEKEIEICGITLYAYTIREIYRMGKDNFKKIWKTLGISYDKFIRTTDEKHIKGFPLQ